MIVKDCAIERTDRAIHHLAACTPARTTRRAALVLVVVAAPEARATGTTSARHWRAKETVRMEESSGIT